MIQIKFVLHFPLERNLIGSSHPFDVKKLVEGKQTQSVKGSVGLVICCLLLPTGQCPGHVCKSIVAVTNASFLVLPFFVCSQLSNILQIAWCKCDTEGVVHIISAGHLHSSYALEGQAFCCAIIIITRIGIQIWNQEIKKIVSFSFPYLIKLNSFTTNFIEKHW